MLSVGPLNFPDLEDSDEPGVGYDWTVEFSKTSETPDKAMIIVEPEDESAVKTSGGRMLIDVSVDGVPFSYDPEDWYFLWGQGPRNIEVYVNVHWEDGRTTPYTFYIGYYGNA